MLRHAQRQRLSPASLLGLFLAVWALVSQVAVGAVVLPGDVAAEQQALAQLDTIGVLCSALQSPGQPHAPAPHHHAPDCALCPLQAALAAGTLLLAHAPALPLPVSGRIGRMLSPGSARAPPPPPHPTALPRGPPAFA